MIETSTQPTARLDLSRAITLLDPTVDRRNRRWGTPPGAATTANEPESEPAWQPLPDGSNPPRIAPARQDNVHPHQDTAHARQDTAHPGQDTAPQAELISPEIPARNAAAPQASLPRPGEDGIDRAPGLGNLSGSHSGSESRSPESQNTPKLRPLSPPAAPHSRDKDPEAPEPRLSGPQLSTTKPEAPEKAKLPSPLKMAGFPEACVEQPLVNAPPPGRAPEAGFLKAAPGSDSSAHRGLPGGRSGAPREDNLPGASAALPAPVQILSKPSPRYPEEALRRRLQGDVLLDVEFRYSGTLEVLGVRRGLGHGLNESAIEAARKLRFVPARRDGRPVDTQATLRIRFQLLQ